MCCTPLRAAQMEPIRTAGVILDAAGNLYGTTQWGGSASSCGVVCGVVFKLAPNPDGTWTEHVLHSFTGGTDGDNPNGVILDAAGNLYGTTNGGGSSSCGLRRRLQASAQSGRDVDRACASRLFGLRSVSRRWPAQRSLRQSLRYSFGGTSGGGLVFEIKP